MAFIFLVEKSLDQVQYSYHCKQMEHTSIAHQSSITAINHTEKVN